MKEHIIIKIIECTKGLVKFSDVMKAIAKCIQEETGFECVGIRAKIVDGDYPYIIYRGFSKEFIELENSLCDQDSSGKLITNEDGSPRLACLCGRVITGNTDSGEAGFTPGGSFWSNSTTDWSAALSAEQQSLYRNRCNAMGYESLGLFPLTIAHECLGLMQLNDKRRGMFSEEKVREHEVLARYIAGVVHNALMVERIKVSEGQLKEKIVSMQKFQKMVEGREMRIIELKKEVEELRKKLAE